MHPTLQVTETSEVLVGHIHHSSDSSALHHAESYRVPMTGNVGSRLREGPSRGVWLKQLDKLYTTTMRSRSSKLFAKSAKPYGLLKNHSVAGWWCTTSQHLGSRGGWIFVSLMSEFTEQVPGQLGLHRETLSPKTKLK